MRIPLENGPMTPEGGGNLPRLGAQGPLSAFGGGEAVGDVFAQAHALAGQSAGQFAEAARQAKEEADRSQFYAASAALQNHVTDLLHNPQTGFMNQRGENSFGALPGLTQSFRDKAAQLRQGLLNEDQRALFDREALSQGVMLNRSTQEHLSQQVAANTIEKAQAAASAADNQAIAGFRDPDAVRLALFNKDLAIQDISKALGKSPEETQVLRSQEVSRTNLGVLKAMVDSGSDLMARQYFAENGDGFYGRDRIAAQDLVKQSSVLGEAMRRADEITRGGDLAGLPGPLGVAAKTATLKDAMKEAAAIPDEDVRKATEQRIEHIFRVREVVAKQEADSNFEAAAKALRASGDIQSLQRSSAWLQLPEIDKERLERMAANAAKPERIQDNDQLKTHFYSLPKEVIADFDEKHMFHEYASEMSKGTYDKMLDYWRSARNREDDAAFKSTKADHDNIFAAVKMAGLAGLTKNDTQQKIGKDPEKSKAYQALSDEVIDSYDKWTSDNKKQPNEMQRKQILKDFIIRKTVEAKSKPDIYSEMFGYTWAPGSPEIPRAFGDVPITEPERKNLQQNIMRLTGAEPSEKKIRMIKFADSLGASDSELKRMMLAED